MGSSRIEMLRKLITLLQQVDFNLGLLILMGDQQDEELAPMKKQIEHFLIDCKRRTAIAIADDWKASQSKWPVLK